MSFKIVLLIKVIISFILRSTFFQYSILYLKSVNLQLNALIISFLYLYFIKLFTQIMPFRFIFIVFSIGGIYRFNKGSGILGFKESVLGLFKFRLTYFQIQQLIIIAFSYITQANQFNIILKTILISFNFYIIKKVYYFIFQFIKVKYAIYSYYYYIQGFYISFKTVLDCLLRGIKPI